MIDRAGFEQADVIAIDVGLVLSESGEESVQQLV